MSETPTATGAVAIACTRIAGTRFTLGGWVGGYLDAVSEQWLKVAPFSNPAILEALRDRDREPKRELLPWSGEFAGKYLISAVSVYRVTADPELRQLLAEFVRRLIALQAEDGYLGPWPPGSHLTREAPNVDFHFPKVEGYSFWSDFRKTWDAQGHYYAMHGLLLWFGETGDESVLAAARKIGDLLVSLFEHVPMLDLEDEPLAWNENENDQALLHSLCILFRHTGDERHLRLAEKIRSEFTTVGVNGKAVAGNYVDGPLSGKEFFELPKPRWESLYPVMGLAELYATTGDEDARRAFELIWWSIVKTDRHNNGGFSSLEAAVGNPYDRRAIETCSTVAWIATSVEMLRLTRDSIVADEIEFSTLNSVTGLHSPNGRWVTYSTPMDGVRRASSEDLYWQGREGSPELNCCSLHGARGFGAISDWALMATDDGAILNWYGPGSITAPWRGGELTVTQETDYPRGNQVRLSIRVDEPQSLVLRLRIPYWSADTEVRVNGEAVPHVESGRYLALDRVWSPGDRIDIAFDFTLQYWVGERECDGKVSIYRGPILLTYDRRFNTVDPDDVPALDARGLTGELVEFDDWFSPMLLMEFTAADGRALRLCDFGSAGVGGSPYRSWLDVDSCTATEFSRESPRRSAAVG
jgi:DUF1680 family protein